MPDEETISVYDGQIEAYAQMVVGLESDRSLLMFIEHVGDEAYVLDLGCGPGHHSAAMRAKGLKVDATDASPEMVSHANKIYDINARLATFDDLNETAHYDGIWANFSLLHATRTDFVGHLARIYDSLKDGGFFHIGAKLGTGENRDHLGRFYTYYTEDELYRLLRDVGFHPMEKRTGKEKGLAGSVDPWITVLSQK